MPRNPKRRGVAASNSFTRDEIRAVSQLLDVLLRGGDARVIAQCSVIGKVRAKFARMQRSVEEQRSGGTMPARPDVSAAVLMAVRGGLRRTGEIASRAGLPRDNTYQALRRLERVGRVVRDEGLWRAA